MAITPNNYSFTGGAFMGGSDTPVAREDIHSLNITKNGESLGNYNPLVGDAIIDIPSDAFVCYYDSTTAAQIHDARQSGKAPYLYIDGIIVPLWKTETGKFTFRTTSTREVDGDTYLDIVDYVVEGVAWSTETHTVSGNGGSQQAYLKKVSSSDAFDTTGHSGMVTVAYVDDVPVDGVYQVSVMLSVTPKTASPTKSDLVFQFTGTSGTGMPDTTFHAVVDDSQTFAQQLSFSTTLNLKSGTNSLKLSCGGLNTEYLVFVDDLTVAQIVNGVYHNGDKFEDVNDLTEASNFNADDELLVVSPNSIRKMLWTTLANKVLGFIKSLSTTITAFRSGDVIPVDGPSGTAKMAKDDLLREAAENAADSGLLPKFDITDKLNLSVFGEHRIKVEDSVSTNNTFAAKNVNGNISVGYSTGSGTRIVYWDISALPEGDYEFEADYSNSNATNVFFTVSETYNGSNDGAFKFLASTTGTIRASFKKTSTRKFIRFYSVDFQQDKSLVLSRFCFVSVKSLESRTTSLEEETDAISETIGMSFQDFSTLENTDTTGTEVTITGRTLSVERISASSVAYISMALDEELQVGETYTLEFEYTNNVSNNVWLSSSTTRTGNNVSGRSIALLPNTTGKISVDYLVIEATKYIRFVSGDFGPVGSKFSVTNIRWTKKSDIPERVETLESDDAFVLEELGVNFQDFTTLENTDSSGTKVTIFGRTLSVERVSANNTAYISMALDSELEVNKVYTLELEYVNEVANNVWLSTSETRTGNSVSGYSQKLLPNTTGKIVFDYLVTSQTKYIRFVSGDFGPVGSKFSVTNIRWVEKEGLSGSVKIIETSMAPAGLTSVRKNNGQFIALDGTGIFLRKNGNLLMAWDGKDAALNPVIPVSCPDPTFIKKGEYFYAFGTGRPCRIFRSTDMVNWELYSQIFPDDFDYEATFGSEFRNCWACDANIIGGKIVVYVAIHTTSEYTEKTVAMEANDITNPTSFVYKGVVVPGTADGGIRNAIDPDYFNDDGEQYIICGSYRGIYIFEMFNYLTADLSSKLQIVNSGTNEGAYVFKYGNYYYLFTSSGDYANYTYKVGISRATSITGPYLNKDGEDVASHQPTTILYSDEGDEMYGPGHNGEIYTDDDGEMYMLLHCHVYGLLTPETYRPAILMRIIEGQDGWLAFADKDGNVVTKPTPITSVPNV